MTLYDFRRNPVTPARNGRRPAPRQHGTQVGYDQHRYNHEPACGPCCYAHQVYVQTRRHPP